MKTEKPSLSPFASLSRFLLVLFPLLFLSQCFQVTHVLDLKDDGAMDVQWSFRFSKALEQAQQGQGADGEKGLSEMMETQKKELPESLKGLVKELKFDKIETDYDSGIMISFRVPDYRKFPFDKIKKEDFPMIPRYVPGKKQVVFHFEPMKKLSGKTPADEEKAGEKKGAEGNEGSGMSDESKDQMNDMGKQISRLFLSSVRYQIFLGKQFNPDRVVIRRGKKETQMAIQRIGDISLIDLPLFAMFGDDEEPFDMIVHLR